MTTQEILDDFRRGVPDIVCQRHLERLRYRGVQVVDVAPEMGRPAYKIEFVLDRVYYIRREPSSYWRMWNNI
jgi:hypothetical protein